MFNLDKVKDLFVGRLPPYREYTKPPHWHCPACWGEAYVEIDGQKLCETCPRTNLPMILCIPEICGSS